MNEKNLEILGLHNPWWDTGQVSVPLPDSIRRRHFDRIVAHFAEDRQEALVLEGPRRVGKSTLMLQVIDHWLRSGAVPARNVIYLSLDDPRLDMEAVFADLEEYIFTYIFQKPRPAVSKQERPCYVVLDEVAAKEGWELFIKTYIDQYYPLRFLLSGSSQTFIAHRSRDSLPGRLVVEKMLPFAFSEVLSTKAETKKRANLHEALRSIWAEFFYKADWKSLRKALTEIHRDGYHRYLGRDPYLVNYLLDGGFPEYFLEPESPRRTDYFFTSVIERTVMRDIPAIFDIKEIKLLERTLIYGIAKSGQLLNISGAASDLGTTRITVNNYLHYLAVSGLLVFLEKYGRTVESRKRALERIYVIDPGLYLSVTGITSQEAERRGILGHLAELAVLCELRRHPRSLPVYYWRDSRDEVDFVVPIRVKPVPIEVKFRDKVNDLGGLERFRQKFKTREAIVITKSEFDVESDILRVPLAMFLG